MSKLPVKTLNGSCPVRINGKDADLLLMIDDQGISIIGATYVYENVDVVAKNIIELNIGDELEFICQYYDYDGNFDASYILNDKFIVGENIYLGDIDISDNKVIACYELRDIYQQSYWTTPIR